MKRHFLTLSLLTAITLPAAANDFYIYGDIGQSKYSGDFNDNDNAFAIGLGYNLSKIFSLELGYHDLGNIHYSENLFGGITGSRTLETSVDTSATQLSAVAKLPVNDNFDLYARLGYAHLKVDATYSINGTVQSEQASDSDNKAIFGVGASYKVNEKISLRTEYIRFGNTDISSATIGASYNF